MLVPEKIKTFIDNGVGAHLTTLNADGSPQISVIWVAPHGKRQAGTTIAVHI